MTEEAICQLGHFPKASMIWKEVRHLFAGQTLMDWTLIITGMVTTRYNNGCNLHFPTYSSCSGQNLVIPIRFQLFQSDYPDSSRNKQIPCALLKVYNNG
jgi:hypothetical protein